MSEETKVPVAHYNPPMSYELRLQTLSKANLAGECRRLAKIEKHRLDSAMATVVLISLLGGKSGGDDPYVMQRKNRTAGGFIIPSMRKM